MDRVTYSVIANGTTTEYKSVVCFVNLRGRKFDYVKVKIKCSTENKQHKDRWLEILQKIEPSLEIKDDIAILPDLGTYSKNLLILTLIRDLWGNYKDVIPLTMEILDKYPETDELSAIIMASSYGKWGPGCGGGHSFCMKGSNRLRTIEEYQNADFEMFPRFNYFFVMKDKDMLKFNKRYNKVRDLMKNNRDIEPIVNAYNE